MSVIQEVSSRLLRNYYGIKLKVLFKPASLFSSFLVSFSILNYLYVFKDMKTIKCKTKIVSAVMYGCETWSSKFK